MKVKIIDENNIIVFFNTYLDNIDIMNKIEVENTIKKIIDKLNKYYKLNIYGYYNIDIYVDNYYGLIIKFQKEDIDYIDYEPGQIDMKIKIYDAIFLYKINNIYNLDIDSSIYRYKDEYFLKLNKKISEYKMSLLLELSEIQYDNTDDIINNAIILQNKTSVI